ncbi:MAG: ATP phosphoribosyltransferase regulatory subunit [Spirochaetaceae bacterium]
MTTRKRAFLDQPTGTEGLYLADAWRHRNTVARLSAILETWGYFPVHSPMIDYHDAFSGLISSDMAREIYRLIDREGELIAIRSDATLFLAKHMARFVRREVLPVRVYYSESILRHARREDISRNEYFQIGAELIGDTGFTGELEILALALKTLDAVLPGRCAVHVGHRTIVERIVAPLDRGTRDVVLDALRDHDRQALIRGFSSQYTREQARALTKLLTTIQDPEAFRAETAGQTHVLPHALSTAVEDELGHVLELTTMLEQAHGVMNDGASSDVIRVDLSEIGSQSYHTGIAFRAYADGAEAAVASGGRYDSLYGHFGIHTPAVGFSIMLRRLERLSAIESLPELQGVPADRKSFLSRLAEAEKRRERGERIVFEFTGAEAENE